MSRLFAQIQASEAERAIELPGDELVPQATIVMDRAFTLPGRPEEVWPWFVQLGKHRAGWYFPRSVERCIPKRRRGLWVIDPSLQDQAVGRRIDDWGGKKGYLEVAMLKPPKTLVYISTRGKFSMSWAITLWPEGDDATRVIIRLRATSKGNGWFIDSVGELLDKLTIVGLAAGLTERMNALNR